MLGIRRRRNGLKIGLTFPDSAFLVLVVLMFTSSLLFQTRQKMSWITTQESISSNKDSSSKFLDRNREVLKRSGQKTEGVVLGREIPLVIITCYKEESISQLNETALVKSKAFRHTVTFLKSTAIASRNSVRIIILSDETKTLLSIQKFVATWPHRYKIKLKIEYKSTKPKPECWDSKLTKPCLLARLFLHEILPDEDAVVYVDTDFIFLESPVKLVNVFKAFNEQQIIGAPPNNGYYEQKKFFAEADYYHYGNTGICAGILLMNLTRIRGFSSNWTNMVYGACRSYYGRLTMLDQGILNILLGEFPEIVYNLDCRWNYNVNYCNDEKICPEAKEHGTIFAVHGFSDSFHIPIVRKIMQLFQVFENYNLMNPQSNLIFGLQAAFRKGLISQAINMTGCESFPDLDRALQRQLKSKTSFKLLNH